MGLEDCGLRDLPKMADARGNLSFIESGRHVPFEVQRVYYLYDVPGGTDRGAHAYRKLQHFIVALAGSFDVLLDDGAKSRRFKLSRAYFGLYVCPMIWRRLDNFSSGAVCMVLASEHYDPEDCIDEYEDFRRLLRPADPGASPFEAETGGWSNFGPQCDKALVSDGSLRPSKK
jgi:hypothetical protein